LRFGDWQSSRRSGRLRGWWDCSCLAPQDRSAHSQYRIRICPPSRVATSSPREECRWVAARQVQARDQRRVRNCRQDGHASFSQRPLDKRAGTRFPLPILRQRFVRRSPDARRADRSRRTRLRRACRSRRIVAAAWSNERRLGSAQSFRESHNVCANDNRVTRGAEGSFRRP
jgi:hypothetical protein